MVSGESRGDENVGGTRADDGAALGAAAAAPVAGVAAENASAFDAVAAVAAVAALDAVIVENAVKNFEHALAGNGSARRAQAIAAAASIVVARESAVQSGDAREVGGGIAGEQAVADDEGPAGGVEDGASVGVEAAGDGQVDQRQRTAGLNQENGTGAADAVDGRGVGGAIEVGGGIEDDRGRDQHNLRPTRQSDGGIAGEEMHAALADGGIEGAEIGDDDGRRLGGSRPGGASPRAMQGSRALARAKKRFTFNLKRLY